MMMIPATYAEAVEMTRLAAERCYAAVEVHEEAKAWLRAWPEMADAEGRHRVGDEWYRWSTDADGYESEEWGNG